MNTYQDGGEKSQVDEQIQQNDEQKPQVEEQIPPMLNIIHFSTG